MKKRIVFMLAGFLASGLLFGQEDDYRTPVYQNEVGFHSGFTTGVGISYRHWFNRNGVQVTFIPVKTDETVWISTGISLLRNFYESGNVRFYGYIGNHFLYLEDTYWSGYYDENSGQWYDDYYEESDFMYNIGIGPGFSFGNKVQFNIMAGYGLYDITDRFNMLPTGEIGLYYRF